MLNIRQFRLGSSLVDGRSCGGLVDTSARLWEEAVCSLAFEVFSLAIYVPYPADSDGFAIRRQWFWPGFWGALLESLRVHKFHCLQKNYQHLRYSCPHQHHSPSSRDTA